MFHKESSPDTLLLQVSERVSSPSQYALVDLVTSAMISSIDHLRESVLV